MISAWKTLSIKFMTPSQQIVTPIPRTRNIYNDIHLKDLKFVFYNTNIMDMFIIT